MTDMEVEVVVALNVLVLANLPALAIATVVALTTVTVSVAETAGLIASHSTKAKQIVRQEDMWKSSTYPLLKQRANEKIHYFYCY